MVPYTDQVQCMSHNKDLKFVTSVVQSAISCLFNTFLISLWLPDPDLARQSITRDIFGPRQLAIHVEQNGRAGEQKSNWDKRNKKHHNFKW